MYWFSEVLLMRSIDEHLFEVEHQRFLQTRDLDFLSNPVESFTMFREPGKSGSVPAFALHFRPAVLAGLLTDQRGRLPEIKIRSFSPLWRWRPEDLVVDKILALTGPTQPGVRPIDGRASLALSVPALFGCLIRAYAIPMWQAKELNRCVLPRLAAASETERQEDVIIKPDWSYLQRKVPTCSPAVLEEYLGAIFMHVAIVILETQYLARASEGGTGETSRGLVEVAFAIARIWPWTAFWSPLRMLWNRTLVAPPIRRKVEYSSLQTPGLARDRRLWMGLDIIGQSGSKLLAHFATRLFGAHPMFSSIASDCLSDAIAMGVSVHFSRSTLTWPCRFVIQRDNVTTDEPTDESQWVDDEDDHDSLQPGHSDGRLWMWTTLAMIAVRQGVNAAIFALWRSQSPTL